MGRGAVSDGWRRRPLSSGEWGQTPLSPPGHTPGCASSVVCHLSTDSRFLSGMVQWTEGHRGEWTPASRGLSKVPRTEVIPRLQVCSFLLSLGPPEDPRIQV